MILVRTMQGLGDAFAARPTVAAIARKHDVLLETAWPEVFCDMHQVRFQKPRDVFIRCAKRNADESKMYESQAWSYEREIGLHYRLEPGCKSIPEQIAESAGVTPEWNDFFMPNANGGEMNCDMGHRYSRSPLGCFRIPTIRTEYKNVARNPAPGFVAAAVEEIGGDWIHLNDISATESYSGEECDASDLRTANAQGGELSLPSMLDLVSRARCVVTPISWMAWAAYAYQTPALVIWGGYASPDHIFGPIRHILPEREAKLIVPDAECWCFNPSHDCAKSIPVERVREAALCLK